MGGESGAETATTRAATNADRDTAGSATATGGADAGAVVRASGAVPPVAHGKRQGKGGAAAKSASELAYGDGGARSLEEEIGSAERAIELLTVARSTFLPGYRKAVDSLAVGAALELATHVVSMVKSATQARDDLQAATKHGAGAAMVSLPDGALDDSPAAASARYADAVGLAGALSAQLLALEAELAVQLSPQMFRGRNVLVREVKPPLGNDPVGYLASEAGATIELLGTIVRIQRLTGADDTQCPALDDKQRGDVAALVEPWKGRPVNLAFLRVVLTDLGVWDQVATTKGPTGKTLEATAKKSEAQGLQTGMLADVGEFDADEVAAKLPEAGDEVDIGGLGELTDRNAVGIFEKVAGAAPNARGAIIRQLAGMNRLSVLCNHLPWKAVEDLANVISPHDPEAAAMLAPYYQGKGGGESLHKVYMDQVDENLAEDSTLDTVQAFGWFFLDFVHNAFTGGFLHEYSAAYDAHEAGLITDNQFSSAATKALGKAAAIIAVSAITGGVAGEFATGVAAPLVGKSAATIIGGGVGGFTSGVAGHFTGDVYDQMLNGKQGFDGVDQYMQSGALGGLMGVAVAGVSLAGASYFPKSAMRTADLYAQRFPTMMRALENVRRVGVGQGTFVRLKVSELIELINSGMGGPGGPNAFALADGIDIRYLPGDTEVTATLRPLDDLNRPMQMSGNGKTSGTGSSNGTGGDDGTGGKTTSSPEGEPATTQVIAVDKVDLAEPPVSSTPEPTTSSPADLVSTPADPTTPSVTPIDPATLPASDWIARLKTMMTPDELAQFELMRHKLGNDAEIQTRFHGNFETALQQTRSALGAKAGKAAFAAASQRRAAELRAAAARHGLMKDPEVAKILDGLGPTPTDAQLVVAIERIRTRLVGDVVAEELGAAYPGKEVLRDVVVMEQTPAISRDDYMANYAAADGKTSPDGLFVHDTADGPRVFLTRTDIDMLVIERVPGGKAKVVHREEVKTGKYDRAKGNTRESGAEDQLRAGRNLLSDAAKGTKRLRLELDGKDITDQIDLTSVDASTEATRGPAGKQGYNESLGVTADDLAGMIEDLILHELAARAAGGSP
jgi:hypothetical protein